MNMDHHIMIKIETSDTAFNGIHTGDISMKMYWDGEEVSVTQYSSTGTSPVYTPGVEWAARPFVTGNSSTHVRGSMTHFNVYDYGVSADEAHLIYNKFRTEYDYEVPPIRSYDFRGATASE